MLSKIQVKPAKGFLGAAKSSTKAPYRQIEREPQMYSFGDKSHFITPKTKEEIEKLPKGIQR